LLINLEPDPQRYVEGQLVTSYRVPK
jgi:hypothetical protein